MLRSGGSYKTKVMRHALPALTGAATTSARTNAAAAAPDQASKAILQVMRFDPAMNVKRIDSYEFEKSNDFMVLDLLTAIKAHQDPSLAFRASCCEGVCGSCAMNINGVNSLACVTYAAQVTTVGPLPNFPVVKDMVVDLKGFFKQYEYIRPFSRNVNLGRYHADSMYARYTDACHALYGKPITAAGNSGEVNTELAAYLTLLDDVVAAGDATKAVLVMRTIRSKGYAVDNEKAKAVLLEAEKNCAAKKA
jgi:hypothetical protein